MASQSELMLVDGESLVASLETEMYAQSTNIIANIIVARKSRLVIAGMFFYLFNIT